MPSVTIHLDDRPFRVEAGQSLLPTCLSLGKNLPYFCWHPALGAVGACRQCAVKQFKDENDKRGRLVMACMTAVADGMRFSLEDEEARAFRAGVIEGLMLNHPHDCPVCDEGGRCHLQDMTVLTGHDYRRTRFPKRTFRNQYLGPFVNHEMNRCIQCYRCVRFYREYAGGRDLNVFGQRDRVYFGRSGDGVLQSDFSGNLVEVCPTGVFTDATLKHHYTRKWDLRMAPSLCIHCSLGCNITAGERYGILRCIVNRYHSEVNGYFLCDRGRFGYEFVNSGYRVQYPRRRLGHQYQTLSHEEAVAAAAHILRENGHVLGIGSPCATLESNFALRTLVGKENFCAGVAAKEDELLRQALRILRSTAAHRASLREIENSDAVLVLGEDIPNVAPRMALSLRQSVRQRSFQIAEQLRIAPWLDHAVREAAQDQRSPLFILTPLPTGLDEIATAALRLVPDEIARLTWAIVAQINGGLPAIPDLPQELTAQAKSIAETLQTAQQPLIIAGVTAGSAAVLEAAERLAGLLAAKNPAASLALIVPECNSVGLMMMDPAPLSLAFDRIRNGSTDTLIILENDLYRRAPASEVEALLTAVPHLIVLSHQGGTTSERAEILLPVAPFAESDGTMVNNEGRAQRFYRVYERRYARLLKEDESDSTDMSWHWLRDLANASGRVEVNWETLDAIIAAVAAELPALAGIADAAPSADFRIADEKIPREPHRYSGRTAMRANLSVHEPKPPDDPDSALSFTMEGYSGPPPAALQPFFWAPNWNSIQSTFLFQQEINGPLRGGVNGVLLFPLQPAAVTRTPTQLPPVPPRFTVRQGEWLLLPRYFIFGSEEFSRVSPAVAQRVPAASILLHPDDAARLGIEAGARVTVELPGLHHLLTVHLEPLMLPGTAALPVGLMPFVSLPAWGRLSPI
jgi:NADH-quinone oxidoreductase subunit G